MTNNIIDDNIIDETCIITDQYLENINFEPKKISQNHLIQNTFSNNLNNQISLTDTKVYLNIKNHGQIIIKLFTHITPKTCENFRVLCTGERGYTNLGQHLSYKNSILHRMIPNFMYQGGDIVNGDGTGSTSIYGDYFDDENFILKHDNLGMLSMANSGPNTNGCQFFITTVPSPHLDGKHVVFGQIIQGLHILKQIEKYSSKTGVPTKKIRISDCGQI